MLHTISMSPISKGISMIKINLKWIVMFRLLKCMLPNSGFSNIDQCSAKNKAWGFEMLKMPENEEFKTEIYYIIQSKCTLN